VASTFEIRTDRGSAIATLAREMVEETLPTKDDVLYALERQKARILERTARGVDFEGRPFAPYSTKGPVYYTPSSGSTAFARTRKQAKLFPGVKIPGFAEVSESEHKRRIAARDRFARKIAGTAGLKSVARAVAQAKLFPSAAIRGLRFERTGYSLKFDSYADLKRALRRAGRVDLTGIRAPHMLQAIVAKVQEQGRGQFDATLGIYGEEAARAEGHNEGNPRTKLPQRRFFDSSRQDIEDFYADLDARRAARSR
jgi:hypothetical protein